MEFISNYWPHILIAWLVLSVPIAMIAGAAIKAGAIR